MNKKFNTAFWVCTIMILVAAAFRLIANKFNIWNFSPMAGMALFAGVRFSDKKFSFIIPFVAMFLTDLVIGLHSQMFPVYFSFALITCIGIAITSRENVLTVLLSSIGASVLFFLVTNLVFWYGGTLYPITLQGQIESYTAALPFFRNTLIGDLVYTTAFFGGWYLIKRSYPVLALQRV